MALAGSWLPLLGFAAVVALIPLSLWLLKRTPLGGGAAGSAMRVVAMLPLGPGQRLLTLEVGQGEDRRWLLLGVSAAGISKLHELPPQAELPAPAAAGFGALLARARREGA